MARVPFYDSIVTEDTAKRLIGKPGALVQVRIRASGVAATVYDQESGGASSTDPFAADSLGRFTKWVDPERYSMDVTVDGTLHTDVFSFDAGVGDAVIPDSLDLAPDAVEPIIDTTPKTTGVFFEFDKGVTGVPLSFYDPPQSNFYTSFHTATTTALANSSLTYIGRDDTGLGGLPGAMRVSSVSQNSVGTCTITNATPGVVSCTAHGLAVADRVVFTTTGGLPTGLTAGTVYYVIATGLTANAFEVAADPYGPAINTSSAGSGVHTLWRAGDGSTYFLCTEPDFVETDNHYGSFYIYLDVLNTSNLRPIEWFTAAGSACGAIRIDTAHKVSVLDKTVGTAVGTMTTALAAATWYRVEWHADSTITDATNSTVTVRLYTGHSSTITETLTVTGVDLRDSRGTIQVGNPSGASLAGKDYRLAAIAEGGTDWFGPYGSAPRQIAQRLLNTDGATLFELHTDGSLIKRLDRTIDRQPGGAHHYRDYRGDASFKIDPVGSLMIGTNKNYGSSIDFDVDRLYDIFLNAQTGRISCTSADLTIFNDPADLVFGRKYPMYGNARTGTGAATTTGSSTVTFTDLTLELLDVGRYFTIGGTSCHITSLNSVKSCEMDVTFGATASGVAWTANEHAYPGSRTKGIVAAGSHDGQIRLTMPYTPFIRQSTIGTCTMTSTNPGVVTKSAHGLAVNDPVVFTTTGSLPTNIVSGTTYYVISTGLTTSQFQVATAVGGTGIDTTAGANTPTHTVKRPLANVTSGSGVIANMPGFTAADVGRAILFKETFTLGEFVISSVAATTVTVASLVGSAVPAFTDAACSWRLTGGTYDMETSGPQPFTAVMGTAGGGMRKWGDTDNSGAGLFSGPTKMSWTMTTNDTDEDGDGTGLFHTGTHTIFTISGGDDSYGHGVTFTGHAHVIEAGKTYGYRPGQGVGANINQATSKATGVTINASSGTINTFNDALAGSTSIGFTVTNSYVASYDQVQVNLRVPGSTTATGVNALNSATVNVGSTTGFASKGYFVLGGVATAYTGLGAAGTTFTGCGNHAATTGGEAITQGGTAASYFAQAEHIADGSFKIHLRNTSGGSLSEAVVLNFSIVKGAGPS